MPDVTLKLKDAPDAPGAENLERALQRLGFVELVNVDAEKGLVAVSYTGGASELDGIGHAIEEAGHGYEKPPGADHVQR